MALMDCLINFTYGISGDQISLANASDINPPREGKFIRVNHNYHSIHSSVLPALPNPSGLPELREPPKQLELPEYLGPSEPIPCILVRSGLSPGIER